MKFMFCLKERLPLLRDKKRLKKKKMINNRKANVMMMMQNVNGKNIWKIKIKKKKENLMKKQKENL